jgi:hypothetical protein
VLNRWPDEGGYRHYLIPLVLPADSDVIGAAVGV